MSETIKESWDERIQRERNERVATVKAIRECFAVVCVELGDTWTVEPVKGEHAKDNNVLHIRNNDGKRVWVNWSTYSFVGKVAISGSFDYGDSELGISFPYGVERPKINVSIFRGPIAIAKDIKRRFLPVYDPLFISIGNTVKAHTKYRDDKLSMSQRLAAIAGKSSRITDKGFSDYRDKGAYVEVITRDGYVDMKVENCTEELAVAIIQLVQASRSQAING